MRQAQGAVSRGLRSLGLLPGQVAAAGSCAAAGGAWNCQAFLRHQHADADKIPEPAPPATALSKEGPGSDQQAGDAPPDRKPFVPLASAMIAHAAPGFRGGTACSSHVGAAAPT